VDRSCGAPSLPSRFKESNLNPHSTPTNSSLTCSESTRPIVSSLRNNLCHQPKLRLVLAAEHLGTTGPALDKAKLFTLPSQETMHKIGVEIQIGCLARKCTTAALMGYLTRSLLELVGITTSTILTEHLPHLWTSDEPRAYYSPQTIPVMKQNLRYLTCQFQKHPIRPTPQSFRERSGAERRQE